MPLLFSDGPAGAVVAYATAGSPLHEAAVETLDALSVQLSAQLQLSQLRTATTTALQAQMEPHFVFNALNTIASFIRTDPEHARKLVLAFADHLRGRFARPGEFVTLAEELRHVRSYLDLEQARFGSQLAVTVDAAPDALAVRLPPLLVQPLVENAVKHGIAPLLRGGEVTVTARLESAGNQRTLVLLVHDTGVGVGPLELRAGREAGVGLSNVERRLACQYGDAASLSIESGPGAGTTVQIRMPAEHKAVPELASRSAS